jgi:thioredoxin 2
MADTLSASMKLTCLACGQINRLPAGKLASGPKCAICGAGLAAGKVAEIDQATHDRAVRGDDLPILVDYWAPWCGPCRAMAPEFANAARILAPNVRLAKLNTEDHPGASQRLGIRGIPLLILHRNGREIARLAGARPAADIVSFVQGHTSVRH